MQHHDINCQSRLFLSFLPLLSFLPSILLCLSPFHPTLSFTPLSYSFFLPSILLSHSLWLSPEDNASKACISVTIQRCNTYSTKWIKHEKCLQLLKALRNNVIHNSWSLLCNMWFVKGKYSKWTLSLFCHTCVPASKPPLWAQPYQYSWLPLPEDLVPLGIQGCKSATKVVWASQINEIGFVLLRHCLS